LNFNLCTEPWIPVRSGDTVKTVSLEEALVNARAYERIEHESPLVTVAVYRVLLTVLHRSLKGPERSLDTLDWYQNGFPKSEIQAYLEHWRDRFDLFGSHAFMQVPDLPTEGLTDHWSRLAAERGSGNTSFLFNNRLRDNAPTASDGIPPAEAVLRLLEHQTFAIGGLMKRLGVVSAQGAPSATTALVMAAGNNLLETLCLNLVAYPTSDRMRDSPVWERDPVRTKQLEGGFKTAMRGLTDRYTWLARGIRLELDEVNLVRFIAFAPGATLDGEGEKEPMAAMYAGKDGVMRSLGLREDRGLWRDFHALVPRPDGMQAIRTLEHARMVLNALGKGAHLRAYVFAQANDKGKLLLTRAEAFSLPEIVLTDSDARVFIERILQHAERVGRNLEAAARTLAEKLLAAGERKPLGVDVAKLAQTFAHGPRYWTTLERAFAPFLEALPSNPDEFDTQQKELEMAWIKNAETAAWNAFGLAEQSAGMTARALRATEGARGMLAVLLARGDSKKEKS
jgi:CRISPR system Cascade subunit CasA